MKDAEEQELLWTLGEAERDRWHRFRSRDSRRQFALSHALLRFGLFQLLELGPSDWELVYEPGGRPTVCIDGATAAPQISLSHTQSLVVCAFSPRNRIGVDAEWVHRGLSLPALAKTVLSRSERVAIDEIHNQEEKELLFYRFWCLKEALLKATGLGLTVSPEELEFRVSCQREPELISYPPEKGMESSHFFHLETLRDNHICCVCLAGPTAKRFKVRWNQAAPKEICENLKGYPST